jgi:hypothetical protein
MLRKTVFEITTDSTKELKNVRMWAEMCWVRIVTGNPWLETRLQICSAGR